MPNLGGQLAATTEYTIEVPDESPQPEPLVADKPPESATKVMEIVVSSRGSDPCCRLCRKIGYPTSNGVVLNGSFSMVYDQTLNRRWVVPSQATK